MTKQKTYLFSDFSYEKSKDNLEIAHAENIKIDTGIISSWNTFENYLNLLFDNNQLNEIISNNFEIIKLSKQILPYEFFDNDSGEIKRRIFILTTSNELYEFNDNNQFSLAYNFQNNTPEVIHDKNQLYFIFDDKYLLVENNSNIVLGNIPNISSLCHFKGIIMFSTKTNPFRLYFADAPQIKNLSHNLSQYSYQDIDSNAGKILSIINISDKIYLVCQYSILRFNTTQFIIQTLINCPFMIYENTIQNYNDNIIFATTSGIYIFDETNIKPILENNLKIDKNAKSFIFNNNLYIFNQDFKECLYEINIAAKTYNQIHFENLLQIYCIKSMSLYNIIFNLNNENINYRNITIGSAIFNVFNQVVLFKPFDFNISSLKQIQNIKIVGEGEYKVTVTSNQSESIFSCKDIVILPNVNLFGSYFEIKIESNNKFSIKSILVDVNFLES